MDDNHILDQMANEQNRKIHEAMVQFLGHEPTELDKKEFRVMHGLGETSVYYQNTLITVVKNEVKDDSSYA
ncbi:MAG: hypothetical protein V4676_13225 [Bacteroidota bacterium]